MNGEQVELEIDRLRAENRRLRAESLTLKHHLYDAFTNGHTRRPRKAEARADMTADERRAWDANHRLDVFGQRLREAQP